MDNFVEGVTWLRGKSYQVFAYFSPDGPAHFVKRPSTYYLPRLRLLRNLIIQHILDRETDTATFYSLLEELRTDPDICPALPEEVVSAISLSQLLIVLREKYLTQEDMCSWVSSAFGKLIDELESGRINYYDDSDWEIRPLPGRELPKPSSGISHPIDEGRINYYDDSDWEIRPLPGRELPKPSSGISHPIDEVDQPENLSTRSILSIDPWLLVAAIGGISVVVFAIILWCIPSERWRAIITGLTGLGISVTLFILSLNPANFYRRWLSYVIPAGLFVNALGFTFDVFYKSDSSSGSLQWDGTASGLFFIAWAIVVVILVVGDIYSRN
jgi:hypothetical protein